MTMHFLLFSIVAICIAATNVQAQDLPPPVVVGDGTTQPTSTNSTTQTDALKAVAADSSVQHDTANKKAVAADSPAQHDTANIKAFDHEHQTHHEHDAIISVDLHKILDLVQQHLQASEQRIIAAIPGQQHSNPALALKSYRTADR